MKNLLKKEFSLAMHPTAYLFLTFACFVFIPNYPYEVIFFFSTLAVFFTCLKGRENKDLSFTCILPVEKKQIAESKIAATVLLQCALLGLTAVMVFLKQAVLPQSVNQAGMDANLVTLAGGFFLFGWFQILFFPMYFSDPNRIGKPFLL